MSERERQRPQPPLPAGQAPGGAGDGANLDRARSSAERLLGAADDAIARALSGDSERYLDATRQSGGQ